jgi:hypothetical protein
MLWVSGPLHGPVHDLTAARIWGVIRAPAASGLLVLAEKDANRAHAKLRGHRRTRERPASQLDRRSPDDCTEGLVP